MKRIYTFLLKVSMLIILFPGIVPAQEFIHPGIAQTREDLEYMKHQVLRGEQPWKDAFERLKAVTNLNFEVTPFSHVLRGPYGKPNVGGDDLSTGSNLAYNCALLWYITGDKAYAGKAIEILNAWSPVLWDFDYNDAKLLAGWTGHLICNAAEILRYTDSGWEPEDQESFTRMLLRVYYPLIRYYFPQANGNWDGAIIHSILAIAVFTDNREMFRNGVDHFLHGPVNGSIFKYIYPSGQCQESRRDQGHVQLGLGEFAGAARVAYTQGLDLFSLADNRIALGFEYTAGFILGHTPQCYGKISERAKVLREDYEYVYRHYTSKGLEMPYTKMAADSIRPKAGRSMLTAFRVPSRQPVQKKEIPAPSPIAYPAGAMNKATEKAPDHAIRVKPEESLQEALNAAAGNSGWVVAAAGLHILPSTLRIPAGVTLSGEGLETVLLLDPGSGLRDAMVNASPNMSDVTIRDLVLEGAPDPDPGTDPNSRRSYRNAYNRGGIIFSGQREGQLRNIRLIHLTVQNCTYNGVFISGADKVEINNCDLNENGAGVVPGPRLQHNLLLSHCSDILVRDSRLDTSPYGSGIALNCCRDVSVSSCEIARNGYDGIVLSECRKISVSGCLIEANDRSGMMAEYLFKGSEDLTVENNCIQFNTGYGLETYAVRRIKTKKNRYAGNGNTTDQELISDEKRIIMK